MTPRCSPTASALSASASWSACRLSGQVIGTGSFTLLDGSAIRTPGAGVFTATGENMENYGVPPDVYVDNTPADFLGGHDRQIEKAIETLRAQK